MNEEREAIPIRADLPFPRLELVFSPLANHPNGKWTHRLCLQHLEAHVYAVVLSETLVGVTEGGKARLPFRATIQMQWDRMHLRCPAFVLWSADGPPEPLGPGDPVWLAGVQADNALRLREGLAQGPLSDAQAHALLAGGLPAGEEHHARAA